MHRTIQSAVIVAATLAASSAFAAGLAIPEVRGAAVVSERTMGDAFTLEMWVHEGRRDGFVAGHPGRAAVYLERGEVVFRVGGAPIAGIYRDTYEVAMPLPASEAFVAVSLDHDGAMELLTWDGATAPDVVSAAADPAMLTQLDVMETLVGGVACSDNLFLGGAPALCGPSFDGRIHSVRVIDEAVSLWTLVPTVGC